MLSYTEQLSQIDLQLLTSLATPCLNVKTSFFNTALHSLFNGFDYAPKIEQATEIRVEEGNDLAFFKLDQFY